jgi:hypothetical protein
MTYISELKIRSILPVLMIISVLSLRAEADGLMLGLNFNYQSYSSFSQQNLSYPMIAGYPALKASLFQMGFDLKAKAHEFQVSFGVPVFLTSRDGVGGNTLLLEEESRYSRFTFDYACHFPLFTKGRFSGQHAFSAGILYEDRLLYFYSQASESTRDVNMYIGPRLRLNMDLTDTWTLQFLFDGRFYLPYLNKGHLVDLDENAELVYESDYYAFYYQTIFNLNLTKRFSDGNGLEIGVDKNNIVGFANSRPIFYTDDLLHYKLDSLYKIYMKIYFNFRRYEKS